jgi:hypothetical protein
MSPEEYDLWRLDRAAKIPCVDCPLWFALQAREAGRCCGIPRGTSQPGRPRTRVALTYRQAGSLGGQGHGYATEEERLAARRKSWREAKRRAATTEQGREAMRQQSREAKRRARARVASMLSAGAQ